MNLQDEINALADEWGKPTITEAKTIPEMVKMARENEKMLCAIQLKTPLWIAEYGSCGRAVMDITIADDLCILQTKELD